MRRTTPSSASASRTPWGSGDHLATCHDRRGERHDQTMASAPQADPQRHRQDRCRGARCARRLRHGRAAARGRATGRTHLRADAHGLRRQARARGIQARARAAWRCAEAQGVHRLISYTRVDEPGTCYRAAGWVAVALVDGREWDTGNKADRWLPGLYQPTTETVDRVRWEIGPSAAITRVRRNEHGTWMKEAA